MHTEDKINLTDDEDIEVLSPLLDDDDDDENSVIIDVSETGETQLLDDEDDEDEMDKLMRDIDTSIVDFSSTIDLPDDDEEDDELSYDDDLGFTNLTDDDDDDSSDVQELAIESSDSKSLVKASNNKLISEITDSNSKKLIEHSLNEIANGYNSVTSNISMKVTRNLNFHKGNKLQSYTNSMEKTLPGFVDSQLFLSIRKDLAKFDGTFESAKRILESSSKNIPGSSNNILTAQVFFDTLKKCEEYKKLDLIDDSENEEKRHRIVNDRIDSLFSKQGDLREFVLELGKERKSCIVRHVTNLVNGFSFKCKCGHVTKMTGRLFSVVSLSGFNVIEKPMICEECGLLNVVPKAVVSKVRRDGIKFFNNFDYVKSKKKKSESSSDDEDVAVYYPPFKLLEEMEPNVFSSVESVNVEEETKVFDKNRFAKEFLSRIDYYKTLMNSVTKDYLGVKGLAKVLSSISNDYDDLKESAIYSLCQFFRTSRLNILSESNYQSLIVYSYYKDDFDRYCDSILKDMNTKSLDLETATMEDKRTFYNKYLDECNELKASRDRYIEDMMSNAQLFTYSIPFINGRLNERDRDDFLTYEPLRKAMDYLSDVLIVSHLSESFLTNLKIRDESGNNDRTLQTHFRKIRDVNNSDVPKDLGKFIDYFKDRVSKAGGQLNLRVLDLLLTCCGDHSFLLEVANIFSYVLNSDYYEASKKTIEVFRDFSKERNSLSINKIYKPIIETLEEIPLIDLTKFDRFSYYFGENFNYTPEQKDKMLEIFDIRKYVIKLDGNNFEEDYNKYNNSTSADSIIIDDKFDKFISKNIVILEAFKKSSIFKDYVMYSLGRDLLFSMKDVTPKVFAQTFCLNSNIVKMYLDEEFIIPSGESSLKYIAKSLIYPLDSLESIKNDDDVTVDDFVNELGSYYKILEREMKSTPKVLEIIKNIVGVVNED